jgi:hypothetical protein
MNFAAQIAFVESISPRWTGMAYADTLQTFIISAGPGVDFLSPVSQQKADAEGFQKSDEANNLRPHFRKIFNIN